MAAGFAFGDTELLRWASNEGQWVIDQAPFQIGLYTNNYSPIPGTVPGDYVEPTYPGYTIQNVGPATFSAAIVDDQAVITWPDLYTFEPTGAAPGQLCYGYFVLNNDANVAWAEAFAQPQLAVIGNPIFIVLRIKLKTCQ